jgi:tRNA 5-methylaminomethyl-2-thiouridine biosynthesis bifunctional protein
MQEYDVIILGGGIAGASSAYALKQKGLSVLLLEKNSIASGDSHAAGAFLSPKISKPSPYKDYLNSAFLYTTTFYKEHFPELFKACGLLKLPLDEADKVRLKSYEPFMQVTWEKRGEDYFFPQAGLINPHALIYAMLEKIDVKEHYESKHIIYHDKWHIDNFSATHLILATGSSPLTFDIPYLRQRKVGGYRYDVHYHDMQTLKHNIHRELSFSCYHDNKIIIGATHIQKEIDLENAAYHDSEQLLKKASTILPLEGVKILKQYVGYRASSFDYFPILGSLIDHDKTLTTYPSIQTGARVPSQKYHTFPNLYIHTALASRGFVFAPYNAHLLANHIIDNTPIEERLSPQRLFIKWARKL